MSVRKTKKHSHQESSNRFELEPIMKFQEISLDQALRILNESKITVSEEEASEILIFLHTIVKITVKEFLSPTN
ncbi:hypothetical protein [Chryseobacterium carnipullorum]|uniref:Uncharacterized protein n=1 Tax=Chryseobacterium carnipullorum TaxID=1124835 RepID=A0A376DSI7_CHRCU|nr:hypothetical protein [Chryseobacterium carnipullorum]STC94764.1 Uncharacterised protein [Chryseobacterium carnipullorum]